MLRLLDQPSFFLTIRKKWILPPSGYPSSSSSFPDTVPYTLQDVLEFQEFYHHRTCNLGMIIIYESKILLCFSGIMKTYEKVVCQNGTGRISPPKYFKGTEQIKNKTKKKCLIKMTMCLTKINEDVLESWSFFCIIFCLLIVQMHVLFGHQVYIGIT